MVSFLHPGGHAKSSKARENGAPELSQTHSRNSGEICRFLAALKPRKRCWRLHGSFILTFAANLEIAPKKLPKNLLLGTLSAPKCVKFGIRGHLKNERKTSDNKSRKARKMPPKWETGFVQIWFLLTLVSRPHPELAQSGAWTPKSPFFHQNISKKTAKNSHI